MRALAVVAALILVSQAAAQESDATQREAVEQSFARAMRQRERGELYEAIRGFQAILDFHPGLNRARLELAMAFYQAMDYAAALEQARRVLDDPATPAPVRDNVQGFIAEIEAAAKPHAISFLGSLGMLYDSNATAGPASPTYELATGVLTLDPAAVRRAGHARTLTFGISHRYLAGVDLPPAASRLRAVAVRAR